MNETNTMDTVAHSDKKPTVSEFRQLFPDLAAHITNQELETLLTFMSVRSVHETGTELTKQGQLAQCLYLICRGLLSVSIDAGSKQAPLGLLGPGQWVGDISCIEPGPASATVQVLEAATLLVLSHEDLTSLRTLFPKSASALLNALSQQMVERLRSSSEKVFAADCQDDVVQERRTRSLTPSHLYTSIGRWLLGIRSDEIEKCAEQAAEEVRTEMEQRFKHLSALDRNRVLETERERILAELHDGVGGQLVAMLAMVENGETSTDSLKDALRTALDDLRLMIDSLDPIDGDLPVVLGMFRSRIETRLQAQNIRFDWRVGDLPPVHQLGPHEVLQILRILQEAVTNIIKHANASVITVITGMVEPEEHSQKRIFIEIKDDGTGIMGVVGEGYGMENMRRRAREIGGELHVDSQSTGTAVQLFLPC